MILLLTACTNSTPSPQPIETNISSNNSTSTATATEAPPLDTPTPQPPPTLAAYGPDKFPAGYNPLTGQRVSDPKRLEYPAILLSVSHFPPAARPQAGLSFAPFVYEYYICHFASLCSFRVRSAREMKQSPHNHIAFGRWGGEYSKVVDSPNA